MTEDYGSLIAGALRAVIQMHRDTSKLLVDCDKHIGKGALSLFGSYATTSLTYHVQAERWMAEGVFRYYSSGLDRVVGVTAAFLPPNGISHEPLFLLAEIQYVPLALTDSLANDSAAILKSRCRDWDIWNLRFLWTRVPNEVAEQGGVRQFGETDRGRIAWARLISVPLFSITSIENVVETRKRIADVSEASA